MARNIVWATLLGGTLLATAPAVADDVRGVSDTEIVVGSHQDLSGPITSWGVPVRNGLQMAIDETNAAGGVHGRTIKLVVEDTGYEPRKAVLATKKLLHSDKIFAMLAPLGSPTTLASMPLVLREDVLHLFPFSAASGVFDPYHKLKFSSNVPYADAMQIATRYFIDKLGVKSVGILYQDDDFGFSVRQGVEREMALRGLDEPSYTTYKRGSTDFSTQMARLRADGVELVVLGTVVRETIGAVQAARSLGWEVPMVCSSACYTPETADLGGRTVEGIYATGQLPVPYSDDPNPKVRDWLKRYEEAYGVKANLQALSAYQVTRLFVAALEQHGRDLDQYGLATTLEQMEPWTDPDLGGVPIDFTETNHLGVQSAFVARIVDGRWVTLTEPTAVDEGEG